MGLAKGRDALGKISLQTGGTQFEVSPARPVKSIYEAITDELRNQYRIGLSCGGQVCTPGYHSLSLVTRDGGWTVQSRQGFYSGDQSNHLPAESETLLLAARRLAIKQYDSPVSFVASETVECRAPGSRDAPPQCSGTAKTVFDAISRTVQRQVKLSNGRRLRIVGETTFGEFGVELPNIFRSFSLQQFQPAPSASGLREFNFAADSKSSAWQVWDGGRWMTIPYDGIIWMDPADGSIRRLRRTSTGLPAEMPVALIQSDIEFSPATVGTEKISMLPMRIMERICEHSEEASTEISSVVQGYSAPNAEMNH